MKILLINPKQESRIEVNLPKYVDDNRGHIPPLGLLYVAATLEKEHVVKVLDLDVGDKLEVEEPDLVGITANTFTIIDALRTAKLVKEKWDNTKVMLGGMHPSIFPNETLAQKYVDYVFVGEVEETILPALNNLNSQQIIQGNQVDVTKLPYPARHLIDKTKYNSLLGKSRYITTMLTSRGCPFNCIFCHRRTMGKKFRARTARQVYDEMVKIKELGIGEVLIYDDTFTVDKSRARYICSMIMANGLDISFDIRTRVDCVNKELLRSLKYAGCNRIHYGVEASSNKMLKAIGKDITLEQVENAFKQTKELGIETLAYFIIGSPGETITDIEHTIYYAKKLKPDYCHFAIMTPYPDTPLYKLGLKKKLYDDYWCEFAKHPSIEFATPHWNEIDSDILVKLLNRAYKDFYLRPSQILKEVKKTNASSLLHKAKAAISLIH